MSTGTLNRWVNGGHIKALQTAGGNKRYPREEVERILNGGCNEEFDQSGSRSIDRMEEPAKSPLLRIQAAIHDLNLRIAHFHTPAKPRDPSVSRSLDYVTVFFQEAGPWRISWNSDTERFYFRGAPEPGMCVGEGRDVKGAAREVARLLGALDTREGNEVPHHKSDPTIPERDADNPDQTGVNSEPAREQHTDADPLIRFIATHFGGNHLAALDAVANLSDIAVVHLQRTWVADYLKMHDCDLTVDMWARLRLCLQQYCTPDIQKSALEIIGLAPFVGRTTGKRGNGIGHAEIRRTHYGPRAQTGPLGRP